MTTPAIIRLITSGAIGALGLGSYLYIRGWLRLQRRRARLERHLRRLRRLTSQLLNAFNQLLKGHTPEESVLYQRFSAYGGEYYDDVRSEVHEALHRSQCALEAAFELHHKLNEPAVQEGHSLEQQVWDWEMLLATLIGHSEQLRNLTAEELRALLDPWPASGRETPDVELAEQLHDILWEFTGKPLRFRWRPCPTHKRRSRKRSKSYTTPTPAACGATPCAVRGSPCPPKTPPKTRPKKPWSACASKPRSRTAPPSRQRAIHPENQPGPTHHRRDAPTEEPAIRRAHSGGKGDAL